MLRTLVRNICSNLAGFAIQALLTFFLTPFVLGELGGTRYGIWVLVTSLTGYYGLLTLGLGAGTTQQLTKTLSEGCLDRFNRMFSSAFFSMLVCSILALIATVAAAAFAPRLFSVSQPLVPEMRACILITGAATSLQFALFPFAAVFTAKQRYDLTSLIGIGTRVLSAGATVWALRQGGGLISLCAIVAATDSLGFVARWVVAHRLVPTLRVSRHLIDRLSLSGLIRFSAWNTAGALGQQLVATSGVFVIGALLSDIAIAPFAMALSLTQYFGRVLTSIAIVFYPAAADLFTKGDQVKLRKMHLGGARLMMVIAVAGGSLGAIWAKDFYSLWIPDELGKWRQFTPVSTLFLILLLAMVLSAGVRIGEQLMLGAHRLRLLVAITMAEGLVAIGLSVVLVRPFGLMGVALGTAVAHVLIKVIAFSHVTNKMLEIQLTEYVCKVITRPLIIAIALFPLLFAHHEWSGPILTWPQFFSSGCGAAVMTFIITAWVGLIPDERDRFVFRPVARVAAIVGIVREPNSISSEPSPVLAMSEAEATPKH